MNLIQYSKASQSLGLYIHVVKETLASDSEFSDFILHINFFLTMQCSVIESIIG